MSKLPKVLILLVLMGSIGTSQVQRSGPAGPAPVLGNPGSAIGSLDELKQFTAGGHVLGFRKGEMFVASGDHALRVEFVNGRPVSPGEEAKSRDPESSRQTAQPLGKVSYRDLWDGVTLVYENHGSGVVKSTYHIEAGGTAAVDRVGQIRLRYNVPVKVDDSGGLVFSFPTGEMRESRPVAWQEIEGNRIPVEVTYRLRGEQEVGFKAGSYDPRYPLVIDPVLSWNTFLGGSGTDYGYGIAVDVSGNVYVTGTSDATWGSPVSPFAGGSDVFVAKLDGSGVLQWNTFVGVGSATHGAIAVDTSGYVFVTGTSSATWGSPVRLYSAGADAFAAKLNGSGALQWSTFLGGSGSDCGYGISVDTSGNVYVTGYSDATWGSPVRPYAGSYDAFAAKLDGSGALQWNTFLGGYDFGQGIAVDTSGNVYVTGRSYATWGSPVRPFAGNQEAFVAKLNGSGALQWNTFLGGSSDDYGYGISVDTSGNVYVTGESYATWGSPVRPFAGNQEAFVAKLNGSGALQWNTFLGGTEWDSGNGIAVDVSGNVYVTGYSWATWGSPVHPFAGGCDAFVAKLDGSGVLQWNTFLGGYYDYGQGIAVDTSGNVYVTGKSYATWGSPVRPYSGGLDVFVAKIQGGGSGLRKVDFNSDGKEDILWRNYLTGQNVVWYLGGYTASGAALADPVTGSLTKGLAAVDMNQSYASSKVYRDAAEVGGIPGQPVGTMFFDPLSKHENWDITKGPDRNGANAGQVFLGPEIGPTTQTLNVLGYSYLPSVTDVNWQIAGTGDFNGDGQVDILWRHSGTGQNVVWYMNGIANTGYSYLPAVKDLNWQIAGTGDFNGDWQTDILWRHSGTGQNVVWYMNGATYTGYAYLLGTTDLNWQIVGTGDFDLDGKVDILWRNSSTGENAVWFMNGSTYVSYAYLSAVTDVNWKIVGTGDFNGDGKVDIIWRNNSTGQNIVWYMNGTTNVSYDYLLTVTDILWRIANH